VVDARTRTRRPVLARELGVTLLLIAVAVPTTLLWAGRDAGIGALEFGSLALLIGSQLAGLRVFRVHRRAWRFFCLRDAGALAAGLLLGTGVALLLGAAAAAWGAETFGVIAVPPPGLVGAIAVIGIMLQVLARILRRLAWQPRRRADPAPVDDVALVLGGGRFAADVLRDARKNRKRHPVIVGLLDDDTPTGELIRGLPVLGSFDDLEAIAEDLDVSLLIIALDDSDPGLIRSFVARGQRVGLRVRIRSDEPLSGIDAEPLEVRSVDLGDLMPHSVAHIGTQGLARLIAGRSVVVTGAGGSIGAELARQLIRHHPSRLILIDRSEHALWALQHELETDAPLGIVEPIMLDVRDQQLLTSVLERHAPLIVFHAAGFKHGPLLERNVAAAVLNNAIGTASVVEACIRTGVTRLIYASSNHAAAPVNVMGATMRIAERVVSDAASRSGRDFVSVRLGNVLDASGSVLEVFRSQIAAGGPITITDAAMERTFLSVSEAGALVLHAATMDEGGDLLILDAGEPQGIVDLAEDLVRLHGLEPGQDIEVVITGHRAGERVEELLVAPDETLEPTSHPSILAVRNGMGRWPERDQVLLELRDLARTNAVEQLRARLLEVANEPPPTGSRSTVLSHAGNPNP
jgi:FlaA1/EpsC-like NDP-sugar epimerase